MVHALTRWARKRDKSEPAIVRALRMVGADVQHGQEVDLYVKFRGHAFLLECKTPEPDAKHRQPIQVKLAEMFGKQYCVVKDPTEALTAVGYYA